MKSGVLDRAHGRSVQKAADDRSDADYSDSITFTTEQIALRVQECRALVDAVKPLIQGPCE